MRNLKRALSLALASVMLLGMMVVGSNAAGFPDVDDADNVEAIEVLQAIKVMVGDANTGNLRPDSPVSRAEMAVVMASLLNLDYDYYASSCPFTDVPEWARGCVGAASFENAKSPPENPCFGVLRGAFRLWFSVVLHTAHTLADGKRIIITQEK